MVVACTVLLGAAAFVLSSRRPAVYIAASSLTLRDPSAGGAFAPAGGGELDRHVQQQADLLTSRAVLTEAATAMGMPVDRLARMVDSTANPELGKIEISATGSSAKDVADVANGVAQTYENVARRRNTAEVEAANSVFRTQIQQLRKEQRRLEKELKGVTIENRDPLVESQAQSVNGEIAALQTRTTELAANGAVFGSGIATQEAALPPDEPASPQPARDAAIGGLLGFVVAAVWAYWRASAVQPRESRVDAAAVLHAPLLGEIPGALDDGAYTLGGREAAAYDFVVSSIDFSLNEMGSSSVLLTSVGGANGKTAVAVQLAMVSAINGRRVTVVDTDMRTRRMSSMLRADDVPGLVQLAEGEVDVTECMQRYRVSDSVAVHVVPTGTQPATFSALMHGPEFKRAINDIKRHSDRVILDSGPLLEVADTSVIATQVDAIVLVVDSSTPLEELRKVEERLRFVSTPVLGYVYSRADLSVHDHRSSHNGRNGSSHVGLLQRPTEPASST